MASSVELEAGGDPKGQLYAGKSAFGDVKTTDGKDGSHEESWIHHDLMAVIKKMGHPGEPLRDKSSEGHMPTC